MLAGDGESSEAAQPYWFVKARCYLGLARTAVGLLSQDAFHVDWGARAWYTLDMEMGFGRLPFARRDRCSWGPQVSGDDHAQIVVELAEFVEERCQVVVVIDECVFAAGFGCFVQRALRLEEVQWGR